MIPGWYTDFWCPADMQAHDPQGCGMGLGVGAVLLLVGLLAAVVGSVGLLLWLFMPDTWEEEPEKETET